VRTGKITWTKTYDETGGIDNPVEFYGALSRVDGTTIIGTFTACTPGHPGFTGRFTLKKATRNE